MIFDNSAVKLDLFHAIQRFTSKIPKKGARGSTIRQLRSQIVSDFKLVIRDPTDSGKRRLKPTPSQEVIISNIENFLKQWKDVEYNETKLIPQCAIEEVTKLLIHVKKGCLSDIPPSGGTSRNEGMHRILNKTLKKSRIGIQLAIALLGMFFYIWNEKQLSADKGKKNISVIPPIESYFTLMRKPSEAINELFGISDHFDLSGMDGLANNHSGVNQDNSAAGNMVAKLNNYLNVDNSSDSSSDECEGCCEEDRSTQIQVGFSETIRKKDLNLPNIWRNSVHISSLLVNLKNFDQKL